MLAVTGVTGAGKSDFIAAASLKHMESGYTLKSRKLKHLDHGVGGYSLCLGQLD